MPRRERATILGDLLQKLAELESEGAATSTRLASRANVPYDRFLGYLQELREGGLVAPDEPLRTTALGKQFLDQYRNWQEALRLLGLGQE